MQYPKPYIEYLAYFHGPRDYFECHEILEEHWKKDSPNARKSYWVGLIQIAVGLYHYRLKNYNGAKKMLVNAYRIIEQNKSSFEQLSLDVNKLQYLLQTSIQKIETEQPYESIELPLTDPNLQQLCSNECEKMGVIWGTPSDFLNEQIIRKHTLRDRSDVIAEREKQLKQRHLDRH
ncbi:DUF309 domain-containing protein [Bacillus solimangrovi]|uniref:DUF309 domain-containing protein n=1 Tax=Bacillus solimangrovi TaxID=1305675 RepID=A0A1E5LHJ8_9BACI|nr:DUF309 domain-containing protein [Bacillus solimangrovi]OEH93538.1 hypothetical protein BFG57_00675 [Bacillus solimangrovi]